MYQEERLHLILEYLNKNKRISVEDICTLYDVSRDTARRDLVILEKKKSIVRTHGGAILPNIHEQSKSYSERLLYDVEEKQKIAKAAISFINENDIIILDTSTTVHACAELLDDKDYTIITNSINVADILSKKPKIKTLLPGGRLNHNHKFLYGPTTINALSSYFADLAFIGALAVSEKGITLDDDEDCAVVKKIIEQSNKTVVLADHNKFNRTASFKVCNLSEIDMIITDMKPDEEFMKILEKNNVDLVIAE